LLLCAAIAALSGCACGSAQGACFKAKAPCEKPRDACAATPGEIAAALPPNAKPGECYAKVYVPPQYKTVSERVLVREASERVEVIPAKYEWVEEKILVKDAGNELQVAPAEFAMREQTYQVQPASTDWEVNKDARCVATANQPARDVFCLVNHPSVQKTLQTQCLVTPVRVQEVCIPAEYQTVRRQKLVSPATTQKVAIPAEYAELEKTVRVCEARMAWQLVECETSVGAVSTTTNVNPQAPLPATASAVQNRRR